MASAGNRNGPFGPAVAARWHRRIGASASDIAGALPQLGGEVDEVGGFPDPLVEKVSDAGDVVLGGLGVPPPGEPAADAAPDVAGGVVLASFGGVERGLVAIEAGAAGGEGDVEVVRRRGPGVGEGPLPVGIADLHE